MTLPTLPPQTIAAADFAARAGEVLRIALGDDARFRPQQLEAIEAVARDRRRVLLVQRTGWGKSAVYFVATRLLRDQGAGPTIIISPLLALMRDQVAAAERLGLRAETINSANNEEWEAIEERINAGQVDVLLISPERLNNVEFRSRLLVPLASATGMLVIDEAHCISDWGHDFRPDYRRLVRVLELLPPGVPVLCTTATANDRVIADIGQQLGAGLEVLRGSLDRASLALGALVMPSQAERMAWLADTVPTYAGSGIVYCLTISDADRIAEWMKANGTSAAAYSGEVEQEVREQVEHALRNNEVKVVAATSALGMGYDKPDLSFVIHYQSPGSPVAYYQQIGRAGRSVEHADVMLLAGYEDEDIWDYFLTTSLPLQADAEAVVEVLEHHADWMSARDLEGVVNVRANRLTGLLKVLEVEGAVERRSGKVRRTLAPWAFDVERVERVKAARLAEQEAMRAYAGTDQCRMVFLRDQLDDPDASPCGRCDNCRGGRPDQAPPRELVRAAVDFIRRRPVVIEPRLAWIGGSRRGRISETARLSPGRALSFLSDAGWGRDVAVARRSGFPVADELVEAAAEQIRQWGPDPAPGAVTYVPTFDSSRPLVPDLAARLADRLSLPLLPLVRKVRPTDPQQTMQNSVQQWRNVDGAYEVAGEVPPEPLLLVDDVVDSRWTLTCVGVLLREAGATAVLPFTLAKTKGS